MDRQSRCHVTPRRPSPWEGSPPAACSLAARSFPPLVIGMRRLYIKLRASAARDDPGMEGGAVEVDWGGVPSSSSLRSNASCAQSRAQSLRSVHELHTYSFPSRAESACGATPCRRLFFYKKRKRKKGLGLLPVRGKGTLRRG